MKNLVIAILFVSVSLMTAGCEDATGVCPHGVCKQKYENPRAAEVEGEGGEGGGEASE